MRNAPGTVAMSGWGTIQILRQEKRPQPRARLDSIADTLAAIAMRDVDRDRRLAALSELKVAGAQDPKAGGISYPGAIDRLLRIHQEAPDIATRQIALNGLLRVGDRRRALLYLRQVATATDETAWAALQELTGDAVNNRGADSKAVLRELYDNKLVRDPTTERALLFYATAQGWVAPPPGPVPPPRD
jgi:hypothetical protein